MSEFEKEETEDVKPITGAEVADAVESNYSDKTEFASGFVDRFDNPIDKPEAKAAEAPKKARKTSSKAKKKKTKSRLGKVKTKAVTATATDNAEDLAAEAPGGVAVLAGENLGADLVPLAGAGSYLGSGAAAALAVGWNAIVPEKPLTQDEKQTFEGLISESLQHENIQVSPTTNLFLYAFAKAIEGFFIVKSRKAAESTVTQAKPVTQEPVPPSQPVDFFA